MIGKETGILRVAVIGTGRTGSQVIQLLPKGALHAAYNREKPACVEALQGASVAIVFTPGPIVAELSEVLLAAKMPVVWGSTGFTWSKDMDSRLKKENLCWVHGTNFSLGMGVMRRVLSDLGPLLRLLKDPVCRLIETHHAGKRDRPSGTALSWKSWVGHPMQIESVREGDVVGCHSLEVETDGESMSFAHSAKSRKIFAEGAIWAAQKVVGEECLPPGLHLFEAVLDRHVGEIL